ncbi:MAG: hypothetical protein SFZ23_07365 [Planctomycetota bacterium]|nr:hypothetical protein [Planctomycetota bacterium]
MGVRLSDIISEIRNRRFSDVWQDARTWMEGKGKVPLLAGAGTVILFVLLLQLGVFGMIGDALRAPPTPPPEHFADPQNAAEDLERLSQLGPAALREEINARESIIPMLEGDQKQQAQDALARARKALELQATMPRTERRN